MRRTLRFVREIVLLSYSVGLAALGRADRIPPVIREKVSVLSWSISQFVAWAAGQVPSGAIVLDAGAGQCQYKHLWAHVHYVAVDFAQADASWDYGQLDCLARLEHLPFREESVDAILCTEVLEHVPLPLKVLREFNRILKTDGHLFLTVPMAWEQHQKPYDYYRYTSFGLRYLLDRSGFDARRLEARGGWFWFLGDKFTMVGKLLFPRLARKSWNMWLMFPVRAIVVAVTTYIVPYLFFYLDRFDTDKDLTIGYSCHAVKRVSTGTGSGDPGDRGAELVGSVGT